MGVPRQLARRLRANHRRRKSSPPVIELMPSISINELRRVIPTRHGTYAQPNVSFKYPRILQLRLTIDSIEILDPFGRKQAFRIRWARTYFGRPRPIIECTCTRRVIKLFSKFGTYACRKCHGAVYTSQRQDSKGRKRCCQSACNAVTKSPVSFCRGSLPLAVLALRALLILAPQTRCRSFVGRIGAPSLFAY